MRARTDNYLLIQGLVIVTAVFVVIVNGLVDIALAAIDPRVRAQSVVRELVARRSRSAAKRRAS